MRRYDSGFPYSEPTTIIESAADLLARHGYHVALLTAWLAMLGSLYISEVIGYEPCQLCWYQRIAMYPLAAIIAIGQLRRDRSLHYYVLPLATTGIGLAAYHVLLQHGFFAQSLACQRGVPCSGRYFNWYGFVTIPLLSLAAFLIIAFATSAARRGAAMHPTDERRPWRSTLATIGVAVLFIALLLATDAH